MPRRRPTKLTEPAVIAQANPTPEQRGRAEYVVVETIDPFGETLVQGKVKAHKACRRQPVYVTLFNRGGITSDQFKCLAWYDDRLALARKGLTRDSLARANGVGGGSSDYTPTEAAVKARRDVRWARACIKEGLLVFDQVMGEELSLTKIGGGNGAGKTRASRSFKLAAKWLTKGVAHRVLERDDGLAAN